jgi:hypothetical protein
MVYRILQDNGYLYRNRIYDLREVECSQKEAEQINASNVASHDDIESKFEHVRDNEKKYINGELVKEKNFEDFVMPTHSRITALNFFDD